MPPVVTDCQAICWGVTRRNEVSGFQKLMGVKAMKGGASGGTVASMLNAMEEGAADRNVRKSMGNPYVLASDDDRSGPRQPNVTLPIYDEGLQTWLAPFVMAATEQVLRLIPELEVQTIESGCCGMAGAFGLDAKHYDVSMKMAELSLLPTVRSADDDTLIVADGTSCRHQIRDGAEREALHVARVLHMALSAD